MFTSMIQGSLFSDLRLRVPEEAVIEILRIAMRRAGRLPRSADLFLCGLCAQYLVDELPGSRLAIMRAMR